MYEGLSSLRKLLNIRFRYHWYPGGGDFEYLHIHELLNQLVTIKNRFQSDMLKVKKVMLHLCVIN
jgi:hypothetical protein